MRFSRFSKLLEDTVLTIRTVDNTLLLGLRIHDEFDIHLVRKTVNKKIILPSQNCSLWYICIHIYLANLKKKPFSFVFASVLSCSSQFSAWNFGSPGEERRQNYFPVSDTSQHVVLTTKTDRQNGRYGPSGV